MGGGGGEGGMYVMASRQGRKTGLLRVKMH